MTERTYQLADVTHALGEALKRVPAADRLAFERPLFLFMDDVVRVLKEPPPDPEQWNRLLDYASPND